MITGPKSNPLISPGDPLRVPKTVAWRLLEDAICKSCLTNDMSRDGMLWSADAADALAESRAWIMEFGNNPPGVEIEPGVVSGFECGFCVKLLGIGDEVFTTFISNTWKERDDDIRERLSAMMSKQRSADAKSNKRKYRNIARDSPKKKIKRAIGAMFVSRDWGS